VSLAPGTGDDAVVRVAELRKKRGDRQALDGVSFAIARGTVFGLIGPNGAGKTTAIKILLGMLRADSGRAEVFGMAPMELPPAARQRIGYLSEQRSQLPDLPVAELLEYHSLWFPSWDWDRCRRLIEQFAVPTTQTLYAMSEGERRRTELLVALAHRPELLILDDPALGLDARARREMLWAALAAARAEGTTVLFTSHVLQDVERIVDDVLILDRGVVRMHGALAELLLRTKRLVFDGGAALPERIEGELRRERHGEHTVVVTERFAPELGDTLRGRHGLVRVEDLNLDELFCAVIADAAPPGDAAHP